MSATGMDESKRSRVVAILLSALPGSGHVHWGRVHQGLCIFTLFMIGSFAVLNSYLLVLGHWEHVLRYIGGGLVAGTVLWAVIDMSLRTRPGRIEAEAALRDRLLRQGIIAYLHAELGRAEEAFLEMLRIDPYDPEAWFRLAVVACRRGDSRTAMRRFARLRRYDVARKWDWEERCEESRLRERKRRSSPERGVDASSPAEQKTAEMTV